MKWELLKENFETMRRHGHLKIGIVYVALVDIYGQYGRFKRADDCISASKVEGIYLTSNIFSVLANAYAQWKEMSLMWIHLGHKYLETGAGHRWQSISLITSNGAAILPAYWALRQKALAKSVILTSSGISSALYHACDVGAWCVLMFGVLQFMDFWLSFMAVILTFVYLTAVDEASKKTIYAALSILTALMAITRATRSADLWLVIVIGATGLLIGGLIEFSTK